MRLEAEQEKKKRLTETSTAQRENLQDQQDLARPGAEQENKEAREIYRENKR